ncbi:MAG: PAS domain-containing sensor histidine kinase [Pacificimonas sp.]
MDPSEQEASLTWRVSPDLLSTVNTDGTFKAVNPAWESTLGWSRNDMVGRPYAKFLHPDDVERSNAAFATLTGGEPVLRFENRYRHEDGRYLWLSWVAVPEDGSCFCSARDITAERERIERIASQDHERHLRDQFLAILGHDLLNPLAGFAAGVRLLERRIDDPAVASIFEQMRSSVTRMDGLIGNVMDFARARLGDGIGLEIKKHADFGLAIHEVVGELTLASDGVAIATDINISEPVWCDKGRMQQVVSNLVANALEHGEPGSVRVFAKPEDDRFVIEVKNNGTPIPKQVRAQLFQPFFRGKPKESRNGLGLGLYIVSEIVSARGGTIDVTSDEKETVSRIEIPGERAGA